MNQPDQSHAKRHSEPQEPHQGGRISEEAMAGLKKVITGDKSTDELRKALESIPGEATTFQAYNLMEVVILSDRSIKEKRELLEHIGVYVSDLAQALDTFTPSSEERAEAHLQIVMQVRNLLSMNQKVQSGLSHIESVPNELVKSHMMAGLQDQLRLGYLQRGIPVEDRTGYTAIPVEGRDFLNGTKG